MQAIKEIFEDVVNKVDRERVTASRKPYTIDLKHKVENVGFEIAITVSFNVKAEGEIVQKPDSFVAHTTLEEVKSPDTLVEWLVDRVENLLGIVEIK